MVCIAVTRLVFHSLSADSSAAALATLAKLLLLGKEPPCGNAEPVVKVEAVLLDLDKSTSTWNKSHHIVRDKSHTL